MVHRKVVRGKVCRVLFFGGTSILPNVPLVNNKQYPTIAEDFTETYRKLKSLPCDIFLAPHSGFFGLREKAGRLERGEKPNPFIDPAAYRDFIAKAEGKYLQQLEESASSLASECWMNVALNFPTVSVVPRYLSTRSEAFSQTRRLL